MGGANLCAGPAPTVRLHRSRTITHADRPTLAPLRRLRLPPAGRCPPSRACHTVTLERAGWLQKRKEWGEWEGKCVGAPLGEPHVWSSQLGQAGPAALQRGSPLLTSSWIVSCAMPAGRAGSVCAELRGQGRCKGWRRKGEEEGEHGGWSAHSLRQFSSSCQPSSTHRWLTAALRPAATAGRPGAATPC